MHKNKKKYARTLCYRSPKTTQERRANGSRKDSRNEDSHYKYVRGKRSPSNIPNDPWGDDYLNKSQRNKNWKNRRKTQYKGLTNNQHYGIIVEHDKYSIAGWRFYFSNWDLEDYFEKNEISYKITDLKEVHTYWHEHYQRWCTWSSTYAYYVEWWYDKDICIEKVLRHYPI